MFQNISKHIQTQIICFFCVNSVLWFSRGFDDFFWICARTNYFAIVTRIHMNIHTFTHMFYFAHWSFVFNKLVFKRQMLVIVVVCGSASVKWILTLSFNKSFQTFVFKLFWKIHKFCVRLKLDFKFWKWQRALLKR